MTASTLDVEALRVTVFRSFAVGGSAGPAAELAAATGQPAPAVRAALRELAAQRHLVLDGDDRILMAHPFSSVPLGFSVMGQRTLWWGGCAWDSFALPHLLPDEGEVLVATRCPACGRPHALAVGHSEPPPGDQVAHFPVPGRPDVGRRGAHLRRSQAVLLARLRRGVAEPHRAGGGLRHGPADPLAVRVALVRGAPGVRVPAPGPGHGGGVLSRGRAPRPLLGAVTS
jgi:hypothetical protein